MEDHTLRVLEFDKVIARLQDQAACAIGREVAGLTYPTSDLEVARRKQKETSEARSILQYEGSIPLGGIEDVRPLVERAAIEALLQPHELVAIHSTLQATRKLAGFLKRIKTKYPLIGELAGEVSTFEPLENLIAGAVSQAGEVMDSASPTLARVRGELRTIQARLTERMHSYLQSHQYRTYIQEPVITLRGDRYCIPIKAEHRGQFPGIVHDSSASGATLFIEPAPVVDMGNQRRQLAIKEREEVEKVLAKLTAQVGNVGETILATLNVVGLIDGIAARAKLSLVEGGTEPELNDRGQVELIAARHPLLTGDVVPVDVTLGKTFNALLITGPNTGGKTVSLKTIGLLSLMAASGLHVPAEPGTELAIFENIFADIGDEQSIEQSLSTFSSHMNNIVRITGHSAGSTLVLLDEIGAGTDPAEGAGLAKAILDFLLERGAKIVATTHYGELKEFAYMRDGIENACVEFDPETLQPTYRLKVGIPGSSNAFAIASRLGLDASIVEQARANLAVHAEVADQLIRQLEESTAVAAREKKAAQKIHSDAEILRRRYEEQLGRLEAARSRVEQKAWDKAKQVMDTYSRKLDNTIEQLSAQKRDSKRAQDLKKRAEKLIDQFESAAVIEPPVEEKEERLPADTELTRGTRVRIANVNQDGEIVEPPVEGKVMVQIGAMRVSVPIRALRKARGGPEKEVRAPSPESRIAVEKARDFTGEVHVRGMRAEEAIEVVEKYLDDAIAAGADMVRIVHGKGTGTLRKIVWEILRAHRGVESYRIGEQAEGGSGATVVKIKIR